MEELEPVALEAPPFALEGSDAVQLVADVRRGHARRALGWVARRVQGAFMLWRRALIFSFWAVFYAWLWIVGRPGVRLFVRGCDAAWARWPWKGTRRWMFVNARAIISRVAPRLARHYLSTAPVKGGTFVGCSSSTVGGRNGDVYPLHSVSLNGCAWMLPFHIGVCSVLIEEGIVDNETKWLGSSGGALIAAAAALDLDLDGQLRSCVRMGTHSKGLHALGPAGFMSSYIGPHVLRSLPADCAEKARDRLYISVTEAPAPNGSLSGNQLLCNLPTRRKLYHALMASCYIPLYYEQPARPASLFGPFRFDGGFSDNQPVLRDKQGRCITTTVSPIPFAADISPTRMAFPNIEHLFPKGADSAMAVYDSGVAVARRYVKKLKDMQAAINAQRKRRKSLQRKLGNK